MLNSSNDSLDVTLLVSTTLVQSGSESDSREVVSCILQSASIIRSSLLGCLGTYLGHSLEESYTPCKYAVNLFYNSCEQGYEYLDYCLSFIKEHLVISQSPSITGTSPSDLVSYPGHSLGVFLLCRGVVGDSGNEVFFQAAFVSILLYGCNAWTLTKRMGK